MTPTKRLQVIKLGQPHGWRVDTYVSVDVRNEIACRHCKTQTEHRYPSTKNVLETYAENGKVFLCPKYLSKMGLDHLGDRTWVLKYIAYDKFTYDKFTPEQHKIRPPTAPFGTQKTEIKLQRERVQEQIEKLQADQEVLLCQRTYWETSVAEKQMTDLRQVEKSLSDKQRQIFRLWVIKNELDGRLKYLRKQAWREFFSKWLPVESPANV
ncbi:uncharacterized protein B0J16DRAFT_384005 [Fusarium flagelliforme]|uniref:uncharacterized protein n=1 Tax=Fusarium flagelliforme TaxID=2675880 RepID=UPI001E8CAE70|nr:uncharacterized protein B0J16DRAFT_384005 [Fusarium flagelliforme]KAH7184945.1 hypothetical protein B0J16DRAFT_384005 [Fusarium flagelliforme]